MIQPGYSDISISPGRHGRITRPLFDTFVCARRMGFTLVLFMLKFILLNLHIDENVIIDIKISLNK
jgi:hypothetical protein